MAHAMVAIYGMNPKIGLMNFGQGDPSSQFYKPYSESTGQLIDAETRATVDEQYERVKTLLTENKAILLALTDRLAEKETLVYNDLVEVLGERPYGVKKEFTDFVTAGSNPFTGDKVEEKVEEVKDTADQDSSKKSESPKLEPAA